MPRTIHRREHWRWQRCGPGRSELRRVLVRGTSVALAPTDLRQPDLLERFDVRALARSRRRPAASRRSEGRRPDPRPVLRSYWRRQPFGPGSRLRRMTLVDVRG